MGRALVDGRLAACVNVVKSPVESIYRWKGKVDTAREFLLIIKSSRGRFAALEEAVRRLHSYDVPEIIALPIREGIAGLPRLAVHVSVTGGINRQSRDWRSQGELHTFARA